jgi:hypothetical protein
MEVLVSCRARWPGQLARLSGSRSDTRHQNHLSPNPENGASIEQLLAAAQPGQQVAPVTRVSETKQIASRDVRSNYLGPR